MRIMVFDVPAEHGGALSILREYYEKAEKDTGNEWIFVVSKPEFSEKENIKVERLPWTKKSWFHRLYFDNFYSGKLVKKYNPDKILSLQNTLVRGNGVFQELYVHQSLPFTEKRFSLKENKKLWVYQNVISKFIISSSKKADSIIVQTKWMKKALAEKGRINEEKIKTELPTAIIPEDAKYIKGNEIIFFYPANGAVYKNHALIYKAVKLLKDKGYENFKVVLTLDGTQNIDDEIRPLFDFCGYLSKDKMDELYRKAALLFPSYVETVGLPMLEARGYGCPVIASNCAFSKEVLENYENAYFFNPFDEEDLCNKMEEFIKTF